MRPSRVVPSALLPLAVTLLAALPASAAGTKSDDAKAKVEDQAAKSTPSTGEGSSTSEATSSATGAASATTAGSTDGDKPKVGKPFEPSLDPNDPAEDPTKTYYFIGGRYRHTILPSAMINLFVSGGPGVVSIPSFGVEGTLRKDGMDTILSITYADWGMDPFSFKGKDEGATSWERVSSSLKLINFNVDLLWSTQFDKKYSIQYGLTAGLALVLGDLRRVQGRPRSGSVDANNPDNIVPCARVGDFSDAYCDGGNDHYPSGSNSTDVNSWYTEKSWVNGGSLPNIYASFGPQVSFRFKPVKQFAARLDAGFNLFAGFFFGLGGNYGL